ncbi:MAG: hypothetical protein ABIU29_11815 [Chthoniobacterales bacterium]
MQLLSLKQQRLAPEPRTHAWKAPDSASLPSPAASSAVKKFHRARVRLPPPYKRTNLHLTRSISGACALLFVSTLLHADPSPAPAPASPISAARIKADVEKLSSDEFLGRGPGEEGEKKTIAYLA